jgi:iron complex outermembrane receptor protein
MGDVQLHGNVSFFNTEHKLLFGVQHLSYEGITHAAYGDINTINLLNPQYGATPSGLIFGNGYNDKSDYTGIYFQDHLALTSKLKLLLGTRYSIITDNIHAGGGTSDYKVTVTEPTPSVGITYALTDFMNVYSSYSRGIQPAGGPFFPGSQPQPQQSRQYEIGSKFDFHQGLTANIAFFNIVKQHYTVGDPNNPGYNIQIGEVTSQGTEANAIWAIPDTGWTITGTYGYTDAKVTKDTAQDNDVGNYLTNVPHNSGRLWSMYRFPENSMLSGFRVGGGMYAVDARQATLPNTFLLPGYASFDAMLGYAFKHYDVALNLQNLTDHRIYESTGAYNEGVFPGTPFTAVLSLRTTW